MRKVLLLLLAIIPAVLTAQDQPLSPNTWFLQQIREGTEEPYDPPTTGEIVLFGLKPEMDRLKVRLLSSGRGEGVESGIPYRGQPSLMVLCYGFGSGGGVELGRPIRLSRSLKEYDLVITLIPPVPMVETTPPPEAPGAPGLPATPGAPEAGVAPGPGAGGPAQPGLGVPGRGGAMGPGVPGGMFAPPGMMGPGGGQAFGPFGGFAGPGVGPFGGGAGPTGPFMGGPGAFGPGGFGPGAFGPGGFGPGFAGRGGAMGAPGLGFGPGGGFGGLEMGSPMGGLPGGLIPGMGGRTRGFRRYLFWENIAGIGQGAPVGGGMAGPGFVGPGMAGGEEGRTLIGQGPGGILGTVPLPPFTTMTHMTVQFVTDKGVFSVGFRLPEEHTLDKEGDWATFVVPLAVMASEPETPFLIYRVLITGNALEELYIGRLVLRPARRGEPILFLRSDAIEVTDRPSADERPLKRFATSARQPVMMEVQVTGISVPVDVRWDFTPENGINFDIPDGRGRRVRYIFDQPGLYTCAVKAQDIFGLYPARMERFRIEVR